MTQRKGKIKKMAFYKRGRSKEMDKWTTLDADLEPGYKIVSKKLVYMSPDEFIERAGYGWPDKTYDWDPRLVKKIASKHSRVDVPYLIYIMDKQHPEEDPAWNHEGRHRALAAKELGIKEIPVNIIYYERRKGLTGEDYDEDYFKKQQRANMLTRAVRMVRR